MRASTKFTTALQVCIFLKHKNENLLSSREISKSVNTNPVVIRRLINDLKSHNIIASAAGAHGGFYLARAAEEITLWDVYVATREEEFFKRPPVNPDCVVSSNLKVLVFDIFSDAENAMRNILEKKTIANLNDNLIRILGVDNAKKAIAQGL